MSYVERVKKWCDDRFGGRGEVFFDQVLRGSKGEEHNVDVVIHGGKKDIPIKNRLLRLTETRQCYNNELTFAKIVNDVCHLKDFDLFIKICEDFGVGLHAKVDEYTDGANLFPNRAIIMAKDGYDLELLSDWWFEKETNLKLDYVAGKLYFFSKYADAWVRTAKPDPCKCFLELWIWNDENPIQVLPKVDEKGIERLNFKEARSLGFAKASGYLKKEDKVLTEPHGLDVLDELLGVYVFTREGSCLFEHKVRGLKGDANLLAGALTAISSIIKETTRSEGDLRFVDHGDVKFIFSEAPNMVTVLVSTQYHQIFRARLERFTQAFHDTFKEEMENWSGNLSIFNRSNDLIKDIFET